MDLPPDTAMSPKRCPRSLREEHPQPPTRCKTESQSAASFLYTPNLAAMYSVPTAMEPRSQVRVMVLGVEGSGKTRLLQQLRSLSSHTSLLHDVQEEDRSVARSAFRARTSCRVPAWNVKGFDDALSILPRQREVGGQHCGSTHLNGSKLDGPFFYPLEQMEKAGPSTLRETATYSSWIPSQRQNTPQRTNQNSTRQGSSWTRTKHHRWLYRLGRCGPQDISSIAPVTAVSIRSNPMQGMASNGDSIQHPTNSSSSPSLSFLSQVTSRTSGSSSSRILHAIREVTEGALAHRVGNPTSTPPPSRASSATFPSSPQRAYETSSLSQIVARILSNQSPPPVTSAQLSESLTELLARTTPPTSATQGQEIVTLQVAVYQARSSQNWCAKSGRFGPLCCCLGNNDMFYSDTVSKGDMCFRGSSQHSLDMKRKCIPPTAHRSQPINAATKTWWQHVTSNFTFNLFRGCLGALTRSTKRYTRSTSDKHISLESHASLNSTVQGHDYSRLQSVPYTTIQCKEIGGSMCPLWSDYIASALRGGGLDGVVYCVDLSQPWTFAKATVELHSILAHLRRVVAGVESSRDPLSAVRIVPFLLYLSNASHGSVVPPALAEIVRELYVSYTFPMMSETTTFHGKPPLSKQVPTRLESPMDDRNSLLRKTRCHNDDNNTAHTDKQTQTQSGETEEPLSESIVSTVSITTRQTLHCPETSFRQIDTSNDARKKSPVVTSSSRTITHRVGVDVNAFSGLEELGTSNSYFNTVETQASVRVHTPLRVVHGDLDSTAGVAAVMGWLCSLTVMRQVVE